MTNEENKAAMEATQLMTQSLVTASFYGLLNAATLLCKFTADQAPPSAKPWMNDAVDSLRGAMDALGCDLKKTGEKIS